jgi:hypothetical protein
MPDDDDDLFSHRGPSPARNTDPSTSHEAIDAPTISKLEQLYLDALRGPNVVLSTTEIARVYDMDRDSFSPRSPALLKKGLIERCGKREVLNSAGHLRTMIAFRLKRSVDLKHEQQGEGDGADDPERQNPPPAA